MMIKLPKELSDGCPDLCPKCGEPVYMIFRTWLTSKSKVGVEFIHTDKKIKDCKKLYKQ